MKTIEAGKLAKMLRAKLVGDETVQLSGVATLAEGGPAHVSFLGNEKYRPQVLPSRAGAVIVPEDFVEPPPAGRAWLVCEKPNVAFSRVVDIFAPPAYKFEPGVDPSASVSPAATVDPSCHVGALAIVEEGAVVGPGTIIRAGAYVGREAKIGAKCLLFPRSVVLDRCELGNRVILHSGVVVGGDGFGYDIGPMGLTKLPQVGIVRLEDDVEIGANTTVDRARFGRTWIKQGVKVDNLVHIAHNVIVGEHSILVAQSGVAGSAEIGKGVIIAAQAGVNGHIKVGDKVQLAGTSSLAKDTEPGEIMLGTPAEPRKEWARRHNLPKTFERFKTRFAALEAQVQALQAQLGK